MPASQEIVRLRRLADITHGTVFYDGSRAAACITAIAASSCDRVELAMSRRGERLCEPFERGLVPHGGVCSHDEECASNGCLADSSGCAGACCPGHCTANVAVAAGGECGDDRAPCDRGSTCVHGSCRRDSPAGSWCELTEDCAGDLVCRENTCSEPPRAGDACSYYGPPCATIGTSCVVTSRDPLDHAIQHCVAAADLGQPCSRPGDGNDRPPCKADAVCDPQHNLCVALPQAGEECTSLACAPGAFCIGVPEGAPTRNVCRAALPVGAACTESEQCASYVCDLATHTCSPTEANVCSL